MMMIRTISNARALAPLSVVGGAIGTKSSLVIGGSSVGVSLGVTGGTRALSLSSTNEGGREESWKFSPKMAGALGVAGVAGVVGWKIASEGEEVGMGVVLAEEKQRKQHPYFPELVNLGGEGKATERYQHLLGYGRRVVMQFFTAYEVGFYVDTPGKEKLAGEHVGKSESELIEMILGGDHSRMIRLMTYRSVPAGHLKGGYEKSLYPKMIEMSSKYNCSTEEVKALFKKFLDVIPDSIPTTTPCHFVCHPPNVFEFYIENELKEKIESPLLCEALFEIYLGEDGITPELRKEAANGIQFL